MSVPGQVRDGLRRAAGGALPARIAVAVSGGGDSVALLCALAQAGLPGVTLSALSVDHGLRPESAAEVQAVAALCAQLGVAHVALNWRDWDGTGNLQAAARTARYDLMCNWAQAQGIPALALGHTADDQAETVLLALARSAGVDGLAAMPLRRDWGGTALLRPMLGIRRAALRDYLRGSGVGWAEDASNSDHRFARIRARSAMEALAPLGLDVRSLGDIAAHAASARDALEAQTDAVAAGLQEHRGGAVRLELAGLAAQPEEIARRLVIRAIRHCAPATRAPRRRPVGDVVALLRGGRGGVTLAGCHVFVQQGGLWVCREYGSVAPCTAAPGAAWDQRWHLAPAPATSSPSTAIAAPEGLVLRALGAGGLAQCPDWRGTGLPRRALIVSPGVWRGDILIAAPVAGMENGWVATVQSCPCSHANAQCALNPPAQSLS